MMRVGIFVVMAGRKAGGPETYEHSLVKSLAGLDAQNEYHVFCLNRAAAESFQLARDNVKFHVLRPNLRLISIAATLPVQMMTSGIDLLHATFTPPPLSPKPYVFTHHCFSTFAHPEFYDPAILLRLNSLIVRGLNKARLIICVSENVRDLTAEKFKIPLERMPVVYNGVGENFRPVERAAARAALADVYGIREPYLLYVGKLESRKNIVRLLEAFHQFRHEAATPVKLVLAGRRSQMAQGIDETLDRLKLRPHVIEVGHVRNQDLPVLYSGAEMFVFPSLWEGFGIPVAEAMACGTPVITSNLSSLPEVAGGAAVLVDPYSVQDIAAGMHALFSDAALRETLRSKGLQRAQQFSWQRTARETLAVYERAISM